MKMLYPLMYVSAAANASAIRWFTSAGTREENCAASRVSAQARRLQEAPSVIRWSSVVRGKLSSTTNASLLPNRSSVTWARGE